MRRWAAKLKIVSFPRAVASRSQSATKSSSSCVSADATIAPLGAMMAVPPSADARLRPRPWRHPPPTCCSGTYRPASTGDCGTSGAWATRPPRASSSWVCCSPARRARRPGGPSPGTSPASADRCRCTSQRSRPSSATRGSRGRRPRSSASPNSGVCGRHRTPSDRANGLSGTFRQSAPSGSTMIEVLYRWTSPSSCIISAYPTQNPIPNSLARSKRGWVSGPGISRS